MSGAAVARPIRRVVGIAEMAVSAAPGELLVTYALGSCLGIAVHDPGAGVGGLLHVMLPDSALDPARAAVNPERFVDTGVPELFRAVYAAGARKEALVVRVAGGAGRAEPDGDSFQIGRRNLLLLRRLLWKNGVLIHAEDTGGTASRTVSLCVRTGETRVRTGGEDRIL